MNLPEYFKNNWQQNFSSLKDHSTILAVSGGADSMVLCDLFLKACIKFGVAHCNFQLRGADSDADEKLVKDWAEKNSIPFFCTRFETLKISEERKTGIQETARDLRYEWLENIRSGNNFQFIATAHHANDNAETLLMNLFKGTGLKGLHAIPEKNGRVVRPLLFAAKKDILHYAAENHIPFREDASNKTDKYLRNALRLHVLPEVEKIFPNAVRQMNESIHRFSQAQILYQKEVDRQIKKLVQRRGNDIYIPVLKLKKLEAAKAICYEIFSSYNFSSAQTAYILQLSDAESGKFIDSVSHRVIKDRDFLILTAKETTEADFITISAVPCAVETSKGHFTFSMIDTPAKIVNDATTAFINAEKISLPLILRQWRQGDYFYPLGMGMKKKKLSRFFIDHKIPLHEKENIWILESEKKIIWVAGMRLDERFKIKETTRRLLKVELRMQ